MKSLDKRYESVYNDRVKNLPYYARRNDMGILPVLERNMLVYGE